MNSLNGLGIGLPALAPDTGLSVTPLQPLVRTVERDLLPKIDVLQPKQLKHYVAAWNSLVPQDPADFIEPTFKTAGDRYKVLPLGGSIAFLALLPSPVTVPTVSSRRFRFLRVHDFLFAGRLRWERQILSAPSMSANR